MIGYLVASVPRRPRLHVQDLGMGALFPDSDVLIDRCRRTIIEARGLGHLDRQQTVDDAIIAYFQGMIGAYNFDWDTCRLYLGQCVSIVRVIGSYRQDGPGRPPPPNIDGPPRNIVLQETSRRLFWALFSTVSSLQHLGVSARDISIPPPTKREPYPDLPIEADDIYITPQIVCSMPQGELSRLTGFNAIVKLYQACAEVSATEVAHGVDEVFDWASQSATISRSLDTVGVALRSLPPDLTFSPGSSSTAQPQPQQPDCPPPTLGYPNMNDSQMAMQVDDPNNERRKVQLEIQKLNIVATEIATRLTLIEKYSRLSDTVHGSDRTGHDYADETKESRDETIKGFVKMIRALDLMYLEPAGLGFVRIPFPSPIACVPQRLLSETYCIHFTFDLSEEHGANGDALGSEPCSSDILCIQVWLVHLEYAGLGAT